MHAQRKRKKCDFIDDEAECNESDYNSSENEHSTEELTTGATEIKPIK